MDEHVSVGVIAMTLTVGQRWHVLGPEKHERVVILAIELAYVLVEVEGSGSRRWIERAWFVAPTKGLLVYPA